jgi:hypothetical protein
MNSRNMVRTRLGAPGGRLKVIMPGCKKSPDKLCKAVVNERAKAFRSLHCPKCGKFLDVTGG